MEAGAHLSLKDSFCGKPWNPLFVFEHLQTHLLTTRWFQSLRFQREIPFEERIVDFLDGTSRTRDTGDLLFWRTLVKAKDVSGKPRTERTRQPRAATSPFWPKNNHWNLGIASNISHSPFSFDRTSSFNSCQQSNLRSISSAMFAMGINSPGSIWNQDLFESDYDDSGKRSANDLAVFVQQARRKKNVDVVI